MPLKWEFPGGKIEANESAEECLRRELIEELGLSITIGRRLPSVTHTYPTFTVVLHPFVCLIKAGDMVLHEHKASVWLPAGELLTLDWAEADIPIIKAYCSTT